MGGSNKSRKMIIVLGVVIVLLALALVVCVLLLWQSRNGHTPVPTPVPDATAGAQEDSADAPELTIDPNAGALITPTPVPTEPGVSIPGWDSITLPSDATEAQVALNNPVANDGLYYLTFELRLPIMDEETGIEIYEVLFTTGLVPPGQYCNQVTLTRKLEPGEYRVILHVQPYRISDNSPTNNADVEMKLLVE